MRAIGRRQRSAFATASFIDPCLPANGDQPPSAPGWVHEIKHDGFRLQIHVRDRRARLFTMTGLDWTERYPQIAEDAARLSVRHAILDAEGCAPDGKGIPDFEALYSRANDAGAFAYAFDLLAIDDQDMRGQSLGERKVRLAKLLRKAKPGIRYSEHLEGDGPTIFRHACGLGLEGIVSKWLASRYQSGRSRQWIKTKNRKHVAFLRVQDGGW
jgi:bifunctional non-homologous end joining protein LigD